MKIDKQVIEQFEKDFSLRDKHNPDLIDDEGNEYKIIKDPHFPTLHWENEYASWTAEQKNNLMTHWWKQCEILQTYSLGFKFENETYESHCMIDRISEGESFATFTVATDKGLVFTLRCITSNVGAQ